MEMKIKWLYSFKGTEVEFESNWMDKNKILFLINDLERTGRLKQVSIIDQLGNEWSKKEFMKLDKKLDEEPSDIVVYFDGGYLVDSNEAGIGIAIYYKKNGENWRLRTNDKLEQLDSNNEAEYAALYRGIGALEELGVRNTQVTFKGDSHVVLKQLAGEWPCFEEGLNRWLDRIEEKIEQLGISPVYQPIDRKQNKEADKLANQALEETFVNSHAISP
ncbi:MAG TPA: reverse transcriptase-like protein [Chondromyces sp.]|nr:reverse transcriptase-like protein [Chondromyces sp.]